MYDNIRIYMLLEDVCGNTYMKNKKAYTMDRSFVFMLVVWITYKKLLIYRITAASKKLLISVTAAIFTRSWNTNCFVEMFELSGKHHQNSSFCFCTLFIL